MKIIKKLKENAEKYPNRIAFKSNNKEITYKELWDKSNNYAKILKNINGPIIIYCDKTMEDYIAIISCLIAKVTYIPINSSTPINRLNDIIKLTNSKLIITSKQVDIKNIKITNIDNLKSLKFLKEKTKKNNIAYIIFTSGSSGEPKGVPITYENLKNFVSWISKLAPLCDYENIKVLNTAKFSFDLSVADIYYSLYNAHSLIAYNDNYNEIISVFKDIQLAVMTPTFMKMCLIDPSFNSKIITKLKCIYFCGEQLEPKTVKKIYERFPNIKVINAYGPTEATCSISACLIDKNMLDDDILPVGRTDNLATKIDIINNEIIIKGKSVFNGYIGNIIDGYYKENNVNCFKTKDYGYIKNKLLYCKGRLDNQIKYMGYRIELSDIENNIKKIKGVTDSVVVAKYDNNIVKLIKAIVSVNEEVDIEYIKKELQKLLPDYMIPKTIVIVDKLPINKNSKIDRKALENYD